MDDWQTSKSLEFQKEGIASCYSVIQSYELPCAHLKFFSSHTVLSSLGEQCAVFGVCFQTNRNPVCLELNLASKKEKNHDVIHCSTFQCYEEALFHYKLHDNTIYSWQQHAEVWVSLGITLHNTC